MKKEPFGNIARLGLLLAAVFAAHAARAAAGDAAKAPLEAARANAARVAKYTRSIVTVRYYVKCDAEGREPKFEVPYKCPNCGGTHWRSGQVSAEKGIPAEFAGFLIAPDRVLMSDLGLDPAFVDRIEVVCGAETRAAEESEAAAAQEAMVLRLASPFDAAVPLRFTGGPAPADPKYFHLVREEGILVAGLSASKAEAFRHFVEPGVALYEGQPNTLVLDARDEPVTVALQARVVLGEETFTPPTAWKTEPVAARAARRAAFRARIARAALPVYLQFEAKPKDEGGSRFSRWSSDDEVKNDVDAVGVVLEGGTVVVLKSLAASDTARLARIEATLPDGTKASLEFAGSYAEVGALAAKFPAGVPAGIEPLALDARPAARLFNGTFPACYLENRGGALRTTCGTVRTEGFTRIRGNVTVATFEWHSGLRRDRESDQPGLVFSADGRLLSLEIADRREGRSDAVDVQGAALAALAANPVFDPENVPRAAEDRKRTPWLGVEVQQAGADVLRAKKATGYFRSYTAERAALVTEVAAGSPAAKLGIKAGDILLTAKFPGASRDEDLLAERDYLAEINWEEAFNDDRFIEAGSSGELTPWPNVEGGVNAALAKFGVGAEVEVAWVSDGVRRIGTVRLALAPVHFQNAPRARNRDLAITVCDMTDEVRRFFKLDGQAPGVVIAKVKGGGTGAVAGLRPLELIVEVNGEGVSSARDFQERTKGRKDLSFTVRRLSATRIVPIKLP